MHPRRLLPALLALVSANPSVCGQAAPASLSVSQSELAGAARVPFESESARVQQLYATSEFGRGAGPFTLRRISLRFDGPGGGGISRVHRARQLEVWVGVTAVDVDKATANFAANLSQPLTRFANYHDFTWQSDGRQVGAAPQGWGAAGGAMTFQSVTPLTLDLPRDGSVVIELRVRGNSNHGSSADPACLDAWLDSTETQSGSFSIAEGIGCDWSGSGTRSELTTAGSYLPGGVFELSGGGFPAGESISILLTTHITSPLWVPGTPTCWSYLDFNTGGLLTTATSSAAGAIGTPVGEPIPIPLPRAPELCERLLYVQAVSPAPVRSGGHYSVGLATSNYRTIRIGCRRPARTRGFRVSHGHSADATIGTRAVAGGLAMRIE